MELSKQSVSTLVETLSDTLSSTPENTSPSHCKKINISNAVVEL